jgi:cell wall-associated NlpC family hydrolase
METAKRISAETGIPWQVLLAIPGNETGWGQAMVGNNYFGIKGKSETGASSGQVGTWEVINGQKVNINDEFRAYGGYEESARDFVDFLHENPRYNNALAYLKQQPDDWRGFIREVHASGYATDPEWSNKIVNIGNGIGDEATPTVMAPGQKNKLPADKSGRLGVQSVIDVGSTAIGSKYVWGGAGGRTNFDPNFVGSDCSGFVAWAYQQATGKQLTAYTGAIWNETIAVDAKDAAPGDLVMYNMNVNDPHEQHVGIYAGNGMMLHDSSINPNGGVDITPLWKGVSYRRVPGVDSNLANYSTRDAGREPIAPDDHIQSWYITVHGGRQMFIATTAAGNTTSEDFGPAPQGARTGQVLSFSDQFGGNDFGAGQNTGDETYVQDEGLAMQKIGAGQEDETDYSFLDTPLSQDGEIAYQIWKRKYAPKDSGWDYDLRGAFTSGLTPDPETGHWPDTYKKPNHPTFSNQSKYAKDYPDRAGNWDGERYVPPQDPDLRQRLGGMGAGQDDEILDPNTLDRMRREEEERQAELARQEQENRAREEEARRQEQINEINKPFELPTSPTAIQPSTSVPGREGLQGLNQGLQAGFDQFGRFLDQPIEQTAGQIGEAAAGMIGGAASAVGTTVRGAADALAAAPTPPRRGRKPMTRSGRRLTRGCRPKTRPVVRPH